jgi:pimeloyl-ACP methyl ester carboxylesterase
MTVVSLAAGPIEYEDTGGSGPVAVLLHGLAMDGSVWREVVPTLTAAGIRVVLPTLPLGSHRQPMKPDADLSLSGMGRIIADLLAALDLADVTLVFNDWGGAQTMVADGLMERVGRLVLTPCEAFDNYPPGIPGKIAGLSAKLPGGLAIMRRTMQIKSLRRLPVTFGRMTKRGVPDELMDAWLEPLARREIRRDLAKYAGDTRRGKRAMLAATDSLQTFERPVLVAWTNGGLMPHDHGRRLADLFPQSTYMEIPDSYVLVPIDQPAIIAAAIRDFIGGRSALQVEELLVESE